jgi:hypothetical protein
MHVYDQGWPELYINVVHDRIIDEIPAKKIVYAPYIYVSGQPYVYDVSDACMWTACAVKA